MRATINQLLRTTTLDYLSKVDPSNPPAPSDIESDLLDNLRVEIQTENSVREKGDKLKMPQTLEPIQIAHILAHIHQVCCIDMSGHATDSDNNVIAIYNEDGPDMGIYSTTNDAFRKVIREYNYKVTNNEINECLLALRSIVPTKKRTEEPNLIAVNNGIFDYDTKELLSFSPDYVFLAKSKINYNLAAQNIIIHNDEDNTDWDVESWMQELSDDEGIIQLLWEILGAIIRPNVAWNKSAWFYSESGNNGKGTLCELMRQLCGEGSYASIPLANMCQDFMLEPLTHTTAIIVDENDVGTYIDKAANLKAIITNDILMINRKFKQPIVYRFRGFMVQCLNEMPRIKDKSDSFYRRQLFVPFTKCFTGVERKYIKNDYLHRTQILEYVLYKVLNMDYYQLSEPDACKTALEEYKEFNDPVREFISEVVDECTWDLLPFTFLYDLYKAWFENNMPSGKLQSRNTFVKDLTILVNTNSTQFFCQDKSRKIRTGNHMTACEPLLEEYNLTAWQNVDVRNTNASMTRRCTPKPGQYKENYRGLLRRTGIANISDACDDDTNPTN